MLFYVENGRWDHERFIADFSKSECYMPPLSLEDAKAGTFLETSFEITAANGIRRWLKNEAVRGENWRYAHYRSHSSITQKKAVIVACLRKVQFMASDKGILTHSALKKLEEFRQLGYPCGMLKRACAKVGTTSGEGTWIGIRNRLR